MLDDIRNSLNWLPGYILQPITRRQNVVKHVFLCLCDHFEPYYGRADADTARRRIKAWTRNYPRLVEDMPDSNGKCLRYSFFYPEEEYTEPDLDELANLCKAGYGEVEVHLHHDADNEENFRRTLVDYKHRLHEQHGLLSIDRTTGDVVYGFIHGNWTLNNSRRDGRWCGVDNETSILLASGCYADFTMPSAPSETQTRKINSIYYALPDPHRAKGHDWGMDVWAGKKGDGLLMIQGPLGLNWQKRKFGLLPTLENGGLYPFQPVTPDRVECWLRDCPHVKGAEESIFLKLYNHGTLDEMIGCFLEKGGLRKLLHIIGEVCAERNLALHFVTAREMVNHILSLEAQSLDTTVPARDFRYISAFQND